MDTKRELNEEFVIYSDGRVWSRRLHRFVSTFLRNGYPCIKVARKNLYVHILVVKAFPDICGEWFEGCIVDHINTVRTDNRPENLRVGTAKDNSRNPITRAKMSANAYSHKVKGNKHYNCKKIECLKGGVVVRVFESVNETSKYFKVTPSMVSQVMKNNWLMKGEYELRIAL